MVGLGVTDPALKAAIASLPQPRSSLGEAASPMSCGDGPLPSGIVMPGGSAALLPLAPR